MPDDRLPRKGDVWMRNTNYPVLIVVTGELRDGWLRVEYLRADMRRIAFEQIEQFMSNHELFYRRDTDDRL